MKRLHAPWGTPKWKFLICMPRRSQLILVNWKCYTRSSTSSFLRLFWLTNYSHAAETQMNCLTSFIRQPNCFPGLLRLQCTFCIRVATMISLKRYWPYPRMSSFFSGIKCDRCCQHGWNTSGTSSNRWLCICLQCWKYSRYTILNVLQMKTWILLVVTVCTQIDSYQ